MAPFLPLELTGQFVGVLLVGIAILLGFRHKYIDGFRYPWQIPMSFFVVGASLIMIVSNLRVIGVIRSGDVTLWGYLLIGIMGLFAAHYFWFNYPDDHPILPDGGVI